MRFLIEPLLVEPQLSAIKDALQSEGALWEPGSLTAGSVARQTKTNWQLQRDSPLFNDLQQQLVEAMLDHPLLLAAALPLRIHSVLFSRSEAGEGYGRHVDNAFMAGGRTDLSFTLFLSDPADYEGGELTIEYPDRAEAFKLPAGHAIVYPSTALHQVEPVLSGRRLVAVGWIQSVIRDAQQRELLFELEAACKSMAGRLGRCEELDLLYKCHANLLRLWGG